MMLVKRPRERADADVSAMRAAASKLRPRPVLPVLSAALLVAACSDGTTGMTRSNFQTESGAGNSGSQNGSSGSAGAAGAGGGADSADAGMGMENASDEVRSLVEFYEPQSMLYQAREFSGMVDGDPRQWSGPYMDPEPELMTAEVAEFLTIYPRSYLPAPGQTVFETLAQEELWDALNQIGITLMHPIAFEQAGQVIGRELSPSIDGGFDRISMNIEPLMGTAEQVRELVDVAAKHGALVAGDIIPLHTGLGFDFRLAQMNYQSYPGIFDMVEVPEDMWEQLPDVPGEWDFEILTNDQITPFIDAGVVPGRLNVLLGAEESTNWSGWAATSQVEGVDGETRRWLYAHLFKPEQPTINWMDPTYNGRLTQSGDIVRHVIDLGVPVNRLDATPFVGIEVLADSPALETYTTQLAIMGTNDLSFTHRKLGGWTWVELNVPAPEYQRYLEHGPDLGYDFVTRAQTVHPLITGDARVLRVSHRTLLDQAIPHSRLIHALQNHDEIAYQLIPLRAQAQVQYGDETIGGTELANRIEQQMQEAVAGESAPYNALYRPAENGVATTYAGFIAPALGIDPYNATPEQVETIKQAHVLLAHVTAMQPGVFALSQWDLVGALPVDRSKIQDRIEAGDLRWINRGAVDLMGVAEDETSPFGLPEPPSLYGPLPEQLGNPNSFASRVADIITARKDYLISDANMLAAPDLEDQSTVALVMALADSVGGAAVTAANYSRNETEVTVDLADHIPNLQDLSTAFPVSIVEQQEIGTLNGTTLTIPLGPLSARTVVVGATPLSAGGNGSTPGAGGAGGASGGGGGAGATGSGATGSGATGSGATGSGATGAGATGSGAAGGSGGAAGL